MPAGHGVARHRGTDQRAESEHGSHLPPARLDEVPGVWATGALFRGMANLRATGMADLEGIECRFSVSEAAEATLPNCPAPVLLSGELKDNLEAEHRELRGDLDNFQLYPVVSLNVSYRF